MTRPDLSPMEWSQLESMAERFAKSSLIPDNLRGKPDDILFIMLWARDLGIGVTQAFANIQILHGKASMSAQMLGAIAIRSEECEYLTLVESTPESCTYKALRKGSPEPTEITYTLGDARRAGLGNRPIWSKHPAEMLRARCLSAICRAAFPDVCLGLIEEGEAKEISDAVPHPPSGVESPAPVAPPPLPPIVPPPAPDTSDDDILADYRKSLDGISNGKIDAEVAERVLLEIQAEIKQLSPVLRKKLRDPFLAARAVVKEKGRPTIEQVRDEAEGVVAG